MDAYRRTPNLRRQFIEKRRQSDNTTLNPGHEISLLYSSLLQKCPFSQKKARGATHGFMEVQVPPHETTRLVSQKHHFAVGGYD